MWYLLINFYVVRDGFLLWNCVCVWGSLNFGSDGNWFEEWVGIDCLYCDDGDYGVWFYFEGVGWYWV